MGEKLQHIPVLATEVLETLLPKPGDTVIDVTTGLGGHSKLFAEAIGKNGHLFCIDTDNENLEIAQQNLHDVDCTITFIHANFKDLAQLNLPKATIIFADLGVSSPHFDEAERGFSFRLDGPLDLRLDRSTGSTVAELIADSSEAEVYSILEEYGEIKRPFALSKAIAEAKPQTTFALKECIDTIFTYKAKQYYSQVFQAFRIAVNQELEALHALLLQKNLLESGGKMGIISFHSLEDRLVKHDFKVAATSSIDDYTGASLRDAEFTLVTKKCIIPTESEIQANPRSRSAKFRVLQKL